MRYLSHSVSILIIILISFQSIAQSTLYRCDDGKVDFVSDASLELIEASSASLKGLLDPSTNRFAFSIDIISFTGFNSALQMEHFRENYMEIGRYSTATFQGRLIEKIDFTKSGSHQVRAKGKMTIHGVSQEIIISCLLVVDQGSIRAEATFKVALADHNISIPKVVSRKIAEEIVVNISADLQKGDK